MEGVVAIFVIAYLGFAAAVFTYVCAVSAFYFCAIVVHVAIWISVRLFRVAQWAAADRSGK